MNAGGPLRILVTQPLYGGSLTVGRAMVDALAELGHLVEVFEGPDFNTAFTALKSLRVASERLESLENAFLQVVSQAVLAKAEHFEPDLVLAPAQAPLSRQALARLRKDGVLTAMWFVEDYQLFTYWRAFAPYYDVFAVIQQEPFLTMLAEVGQANALYLPLAASPEFHKPLDLTPVERRKYGADVAFLGAGYPNRRVAFRALMRYDFKIWGSDWEGETVLAPHLQRNGARIAPEEAVRIFNATAVNLNLHSSVRADTPVSKGDFVNPRTFELASCSAFQLVDERELLPPLFGPEEVVSFTTMAECVELLDHYLAHPEARAEKARAARRRVLAEHTYAKRMETLLAFVEARFPGRLGARRRETLEAWAQTMPEALRGETLALLERLGLTPDAAFDDLVWRLRRQQGVLTSLETAILFLDEWRKQYMR